MWAVLLDRSRRLRKKTKERYCPTFDSSFTSPPYNAAVIKNPSTLILFSGYHSKKNISHIRKRIERIAIKESRAMNKSSLVFIFVGFLIAARIDSSVDCDSNQESKLSSNCVAPEEKENQEVVVELAVSKIGFSTFSLNANKICRKGYQLNPRGVCTRVFGAPIETTPIPSK